MFEAEPEDIWIKRAFGLLELQRLKEAKQAVLEALAANPDSVSAFSLLTRIEYKLRDFEACRRSAESVLARDPQNVQALLFLALASFYDPQFQPPSRVRWYQLETGDPRLKHAEALVRSAIAIDPALPNSWNILGRLQFSAGQLKKALQSIDHALALGVPDAETLLVRSQILRKLGNHSLADDALRVSLSLSPENSIAHAEAARIAFVQQDLTAAAEHASEAVRLDPGNPANREQFFRSLQVRSPVTKALLRFELLMIRIRHWPWPGKLAWILGIVVFGVLLLHKLGLQERLVLLPPMMIALFPFIPVGPAECARLIQILNQKSVIEHRRVRIFDLACRAALPFLLFGGALGFLCSGHVGFIVATTVLLLIGAGLLDFLNARFKD